MSKSLRTKPDTKPRKTIKDKHFLASSFMEKVHTLKYFVAPHFNNRSIKQ